jgi:hypothetical protein
VWSIPLMGFIGTVIGISSAVSGFSGFLQEAEEIEQIKTGIGGVTTGLAVAFDTTLFALALSVLVMIVLVAVERWESRLLLGIDSDVGDAVVARLPEGRENRIDAAAIEQAVRRAVGEEQTEALRQAVREAVEASLPSPEEIVAPAREFLRQAAEEITGSARVAAHGIGEASSRIAQYQEAVVGQMRAQQDAFALRMDARDQRSAQLAAAAAEDIRQQAQEMLCSVRERADRSAAVLEASLTAVSERLDQVSELLARRLDALSTLSERASEAIALEQSLSRTLASLETAGDLRGVLSGVRTSLEGLQPALGRLAQPRRITLVEANGAVGPEGVHGQG